jgi:hypothetical protein
MSEQDALDPTGARAEKRSGSPFPCSVPVQRRGQHVRSRRLYGHPARTFETHFFNQENRTAASVSVLPASSHKYGDGHARVVFHQYSSQYFLAIVSEGSLDSTFGVYTSKEETQLANASPQKPVTTVSVIPSRGALQATVRPQK